MREIYGALRCLLILIAFCAATICICCPGPSPLVGGCSLVRSQLQFEVRWANLTTTKDASYPRIGRLMWFWDVRPVRAQKEHDPGNMHSPRANICWM